MRYLGIIIVIFFGLASCNQNTCGDAYGEIGISMVKQANKIYPDEIIIEILPCEFYYINVINNSVSIDTSKLKQVVKKLYDKEKKIGWPVSVIYNNSHTYLFSINDRGLVFVQKGD